MAEQEPRTITRSEYHQLCGLLLLSQRHDRALDEMKRAVADLLGDEDWASDAVRGGVADYDADDLLQRMGIEIVE